MDKIKIDGKEFLIKQSFRSLMEFEKMTKKPAPEMDVTVNDLITLFYCVLKAANKETFDYSFENFIDVLDNNSEVLNEFSNYLIKQQQGTQTETKKKKVK
jgi:spore coat polysaccharide biosynthesis protein SpsF (cytidylyltransferase family)